MRGARSPGSPSQGFERIGILGTSLGSCLCDADLGARAAHPRAGAQPRVAVVCRRRLARAVDAARARRGSTATSISSGCGSCGGRSARGPISIAVQRHAKTLLVYARYDLTFPVDLSRMLVDEFAQRGICRTKSPCCRAATTAAGMAPFKFLDGYVLTQFLRRNL